MEHFDIFEEDVRLGVDGPPSTTLQSIIPEGVKPEEIHDEYDKAMARLSPELHAQVKKATQILKKSAFPRRYSPINGMDEALNECILPSYTGNLYTVQPRAGLVFFGGAKMQSVIIYEERKSWLRNWLADRFSRHKVAY